MRKSPERAVPNHWPTISGLVGFLVRVSELVVKVSFSTESALLCLS